MVAIVGPRALVGYPSCALDWIMTSSSFREGFLTKLVFESLDFLDLEGRGFQFI